MAKEKVILDTDIGSDIDDSVALAYLLMQEKCDLLGVTTVSGQPEKRAMMVGPRGHSRLPRRAHPNADRRQTGHRAAGGSACQMAARNAIPHGRLPRIHARYHPQESR